MKERTHELVSPLSNTYNLGKNYEVVKSNTQDQFASTGYKQSNYSDPNMFIGLLNVVGGSSSCGGSLYMRPSW